MQRPGPLQQRTSSWATEQTNGASCPRISLPQAMGSWPLAQLLFYQYKRTEQRAEQLRGNGSTQSKAIRWWIGKLISKAIRFSTECPAGRAAARGNLGPSSSSSTRAKARLPQPREDSHACTPSPAPERRAAAAGRCTPRRSRGTLKDGRRRPEPCGACSARSGKSQQSSEITAVSSLKSADVLLPQS